ncbi:hypothetical protein BC937DRAFT_88934 [Endogone sp. FLAS-F59071]|nr:hypothetical protein BC937DRAFT_88934 [Endogone sp. FLAS-F59071]|eukprot:RUS18313.1 hypothetical protein BC937DRAFT_88934 [Endogone sp. FLAS-F59071]
MSNPKNLPLLPPEILLCIFNILKSSSEPYLVTFLAVSLVCRAWQFVALPLIHRELANLQLRHYSALHLRRLANSLNETRTTGAFDLAGYLQSVTIALNDFYVRRRTYHDSAEYGFNYTYSSSASAVIQKLPNFPSLSLHFPNITTDRQFRDTSTFLTHLAFAHGTAITSLHLDGFHNPVPRHSANPLADLLRSLSNLTDIRFWSVHVDDRLATALSNLQYIHTAQFLRTTHSYSSDPFSCWLNLHSFDLSTSLQFPCLLLTLRGLASSCPRLTSLRLHTPYPPYHSTDLVAAIASLLASQATTLVHFALPDLPARLNIMPLLKIPLPQLESLEISGVVTANEFPAGEMWPKLCKIDVTQLKPIKLQFVEEVVRACPRVSEIRVWADTDAGLVKGGNYEQEWKSMVEEGFNRCGGIGSGLWLRKEMEVDRNA